MKKTFQAIMMLAVIALVFTGCKKDEEEGCFTVNNTWTLAGSSFTASSLVPPSFSGASLNAATSNLDLVSIEFPVKPTASGTYTAVLATGAATGNQCKITARINGSPLLYFSTNSTGSVEVCVEEGKVSVRASGLTLTYIEDSTEKTAPLTFQIGA